MNLSLHTSSAGPRFWTLGYRRYYSPLMRTPGGRSAANRMAASLDRPGVMLPGSRVAAAGVAAPAADRASDHVHGVQ
jgi:hypothetical protein